MVAAEVTLAAIGLGIAGVNLATGAYDAPLSQGDEDDSGQESDIIIRVGIPATFGAVFAFAAAVDIAAADHRKETVRTGRRLPDTFAPCTNKILHGVTVEIRNGDKSIASRFDENARAYFDVPPALAEQLEKDAFVDVVIHGTSLARVYVDR